MKKFILLFALVTTTISAQTSQMNSANPGNLSNPTNSNDLTNPSPTDFKALPTDNEIQKEEERDMMNPQKKKQIDFNKNVLDEDAVDISD